MIQFFLLQNRQGKVRAAKWWVPYDDAEKAKLVLEIHRLVNSRRSKDTNFIEFRNYKAQLRFFFQKKKVFQHKKINRK